MYVLCVCVCVCVCVRGCVRVSGILCAPGHRRAAGATPPVATATPVAGGCLGMRSDWPTDESTF